MRKRQACLLLVSITFICCVFAACTPKINLDEEYSYTDEERAFPFWQGNVMRNEQVMVVEKDGVIQGKLLYPALKIIAIYDYSLTRLFEENVDYVVNGDTITLPQGSSIPVFKDEWSLGKNIPEEYPFGDVKTGYRILSGVLHAESKLIYGNYINVSYVYDSSKIDKSVFPKFENKLTKLKKILSTQQNVKLAIYGDSISVGYSSSSSMSREPNQPSYGEIVAAEIQRKSNATVEYKNFSVGGTGSYWATQNPQLQQIADYAPDICVIAFGTNDGLESFENNFYYTCITDVVDALKQANPNCQILLVAPFPCNPAYKEPKAHEYNVEQLKKIAKDNRKKDTVCVDVYTPCVKMLEKKHYYELSASNINHPNDFIHRFYAMCILNVMFDYSR